MTTLNLHWPMPPFYVLADGQTRGVHGRDCVVELIQGQVVAGMLNSMGCRQLRQNQ